MMERYTATVIVGRRTLVVVERATEGDERILDLFLDGAPVGVLRLLVYYLPGIAYGESHIAIWGGMRLYLLPLGGGEAIRVDQEDEVHDAYSFDHRWLLVCETSVVLTDPLVGRVFAHYSHDEVLLSCRWSGQTLIVDDLQERHLVFDLASAEPSLRPILGDRNR